MVLPKFATFDFRLAGRMARCPDMIVPMKSISHAAVAVIRTAADHAARTRAAVIRGLAAAGGLTSPRRHWTHSLRSLYGLDRRAGRVPGGPSRIWTNSGDV